MKLNKLVLSRKNISLKTRGSEKVPHSTFCKTRNTGTGNDLHQDSGECCRFNIKGNVLGNVREDTWKCSGNGIKDSGECSRRFQGMFKKILSNVLEDFRGCLRIFQGMLKKIARNLNFDLCREMLLVFYSNFANKLLQSDGIKHLLSNISKENIFYTAIYN